MKLFISWSLHRGRELGLLLREWLPEVIQLVDPWMSSEDIVKGQRWATVLGSRLSELTQGVICVTPENLGEAWLNFEAGALARALDESRVRPVLLGLNADQVTGPLAQFQATIATDSDDMLRLVRSLNSACDVPLSDVRLKRAFDRTWPACKQDILRLEQDGMKAELAHRRKLDEAIFDLDARVRSIHEIVDTFPETIREKMNEYGDLRETDGYVYGMRQSHRVPSEAASKVAEVQLPYPQTDQPGSPLPTRSDEPRISDTPSPPSE